MTPPRLASCLAVALLGLSLGASRAADEPNLDATELFQQVDPSVVTVEMANGSGSGFIISADGYILTNGHVVAGDDPEDPQAPSRRVSVGLYNDKQYPARVIGLNLDPDCALLKIEPDEPLVPVKIGDSAAVKTGQTVYVFGQPLRMKRNLTKGIISHVDRTDMPTFIPILGTDAAINHGNSGGPMFDEQGRVLGLNTYGAARGSQGLNFTIPINPVLVVAESYKKHGRFRRSDIPFMAFQEVYDDLGAALGVEKGILVPYVVPGSEAERSGFASGDVIVEVDSQPVSARDEAGVRWFNWRMSTQEIGKTSTFKVMRRVPGGAIESKILTAVFREAEPAPRGRIQVGEIPQTLYDDLGIGVQRIVQDARLSYVLPQDPGVLVSVVIPGSPAQRAGLIGGGQSQPTDIILSVEGVPTPDPDAFEAQIMEHLRSHRKAIRMTYKRKKEVHVTALAPHYRLRGKRIAILTPEKDPEWKGFVRRHLSTSGADLVFASESGKAGSRISDLKAGDLDAILLMAGDGKQEFMDEPTQALIREMVKADKVLGGVGSASVALVKADAALQQKKWTTSKERSQEETLKGYTGKVVESDGKLVTTTGFDKVAMRAFLQTLKGSMN